MTVKSYIKEPFNISRFSEDTYRQGTLFVPAGTKDLYILFDGWREFLKIEEMEEGATSSPNGACATPTITIIGKKIKLSCETPGATFSSTLTTKEQLTGDELIMESRDVTYTLTVVASAEGYDDSAPATVNFTIPSGDLNGDGAVNSADVQRIYSIMAAEQ